MGDFGIAAVGQAKCLVELGPCARRGVSRVEPARNRSHSCVDQSPAPSWSGRDRAVEPSSWPPGRSPRAGRISVRRNSPEDPAAPAMPIRSIACADCGSWRKNRSPRKSHEIGRRDALEHVLVKICSQKGVESRPAEDLLEQCAETAIPSRRGSGSCRHRGRGRSGRRARSGLSRESRPELLSQLGQAEHGLHVGTVIVHKCLRRFCARYRL